MKVAAFQAPLLAEGSMGAIELIQQRVRECEADGVSVLCCPEAILGGLADFSDNPVPFAIRTGDGQLASLLTPLASDTVTSIVGFTEVSGSGALWSPGLIEARPGAGGFHPPKGCKAPMCPGAQPPTRFYKSCGGGLP